jgi:pimeloyl-ACP methyl ester carboxylesterase
MPPVRIELLVGIIIALAGIGFGIDLLLTRVSKRQQIAAFILPLVASSIIPATGYIVLRWDRVSLLNSLPYIGLTPIHQGERIVLETGAVAWLDRPSGKGPFPGVVFFHGANADGSKQSSAIVLRRALLDAGFVVLSVDHPAGYGESPAPEINDQIEAWDPLPTVLAELKALRAMSDVDKIFAFGHSMGVREVLRLLSVNVEPKLTGAVVFGGRMHEAPSELSEYWYERFHTDRRIPYRLPKEKIIEIHARFYDGKRIVQALEPDHPPILFVRFGYEWPDVAATRDELYASLPGRKTSWDLGNSTHYFSSWKKFGLVVGDTRVTRLLSRQFRLLASKK